MASRSSSPPGAARGRDTSAGPYALSEEQIRAYDRSRLRSARGTLCHAPFKTLRFNPGGKVVPCSQNSIYELGTYPLQTVRGIWEGATIAALREQVAAYQLATGCHECQQAFEEGNFGSVRATMYDGLPSHPSSPTLLDFKLDNVCNLACVQCSSYSSSRLQRAGDDAPVRKAAYDERFVEQLAEFLPSLHEARFTGGEPFLIDLYYRVWERLAEQNPDCRVWIQTNGVVLNDRIGGLLARLNVGLNVSIDSLQKERFESIRLGARYEVLRENLEYFRAYCRERGTELTVNTCAMRENWEEIPDIVEFCNGIGVRIAFCFVWFPAEHALWTMPAPAIDDICDRFRRVVLPDRTEVERRNQQRFRELTDTLKACHEAAVARQHAAERAASPLTEQDVYQSLAAGCRSLAASETHERELVALLHGRLRDGFADAPARQRFVAYISLFLSMFSADIIVDTLLNEPMDKIRRDVDAFWAPGAAR